jgi:hypothetical protein
MDTIQKPSDSVKLYYYLCKLRGLSPRANYTDRATATLSAKLMPTFSDRGVSCSQRGGSPTAVISSYIYLFNSFPVISRHMLGLKGYSFKVSQ